jgi:hypothetical protein
MTARKKGGEGIASTQSQPGGYKGGRWLAWHPGRFIPREHPYLSHGRLGKP